MEQQVKEWMIWRWRDRRCGGAIRYTVYDMGKYPHVSRKDPQVHGVFRSRDQAAAAAHTLRGLTAPVGDDPVRRNPGTGWRIWRWRDLAGEHRYTILDLRDPRNWWVSDDDPQVVSSSLRRDGFRDWLERVSAEAEMPQAARS